MSTDAAESNTTNGTTTTDDSSSEMAPLNVNVKRAVELLENISGINTRILNTCKSHNISKQPRLVAVSKLKPATDILALHQPPQDALKSASESSIKSQSHFGENYVQELIQKSQLLPSSIRWHFIGGLQSNKCAQLAREVRSLWAVESVDSTKKAQLLDKGRGQRNEELKKEQTGDAGQEADEKLRVFVQVNTSGEDSKSGVEPKSEDLLQLCRTIKDDCSNLQLQGLMTIGAIARSKASTAETENEDFMNLKENRDWVVEKLGVDGEQLELSMGMSEDFESAIRQNSSEVRVGSTIFGQRPPKSEAKVLENTEEEKK